MSSNPGDTPWDKLNKLYDKVTFMDKHGIDVWMVIIICIVFFIAFTYYTILNNLQPIKANWIHQRCNPEVLPFAGIINNSGDTTPMEFTANNFTFCIRSILENIVGYAFQPLQYMLSLITSTFTVLATAINSIREQFDYLRNSITNITKTVLGKALNFVIPILTFILQFKDIMGKVSAAAAAAINSVMAAYLGAQSLMLVFVEIFIVVLVAIVVIVAVFWLIPLIGPGLVITGTAVFMLLLIPTVRIQLFMKDILKLQVTSPPDPPACFSKHTKLVLKNQILKNIDAVEIGDVLHDDSTVTGIMQLSSAHQSVYILHGVVVTGNHSVYHKEKGWISVEEHPDSSLLNEFTEPFVYCINTDKKTICLGNTIYADWDDLDEIDIKDMKTTCVNVGLLPQNFTMKDIHYYLDNGFHEESIVNLQYGARTTIKDINIGDVLMNGEKVVGKIKIDAKNIQGVYYFDINGIKIKCSKNINIRENSTENITKNTSFMNGNEITDVDYLYNIVTDLGTLNISGLIVDDYNSGLEKFLNIHK